MKQLIVFLSLIFLFTSFRPSLLLYSPFPDLMLDSDLIVLGEIKDIDSNSYQLRVDSIISGKCITKTIGLDKPRFYTRWDHYRVGQKQLTFLKYSKLERKWTRTFNSNAEYPMNDSIIFVHNDGWHIGKNYEKYPGSIKFNTQSVHYDSYSKKELIDAIREFLKNKKTLLKKICGEPDFQYILRGQLPLKTDIKLTDPTLIAFSTKSLSHLRIIDQIMDGLCKTPTCD